MPLTLARTLTAESGPVSFELRGHVPGKKNAWTRRKGGGMYLPAEIENEIASLTMQARGVWGANAPLDRAHVKAIFFLKDRRGDLDGKLVTILDCLVKARVIVNDSIAHLPSFEAKAVVTSLDERTEVTIT